MKTPFKNIYLINCVQEDSVNLLGYTIWRCIDCVSFTTGEDLSN